MVKTQYRVVPDTNVILSAQFGGETSPSKEFFLRWRDEEFVILFSDSTMYEYAEKLEHFGVDEETIIDFLSDLKIAAEEVDIVFYHHRRYPIDPDDIAFVLCADNGNATDLLSYDRHLLVLQGVYEFEILQPLDFLHKLRKHNQ